MLILQIKLYLLTDSKFSLADAFAIALGKYTPPTATTVSNKYIFISKSMRKMREEMIEVAEDILVELNQVIVDMESEGLQTNYEQINRKIDVRLFCLKETFAIFMQCVSFTMSVWVYFYRKPHIYPKSSHI